MNTVFQEIEKWNSKGYEFSFQFWGSGNNNVFVMKERVDLFDTGGFLTPLEAIQEALDQIYRLNKTPVKDRVVVFETTDDGSTYECSNCGEIRSKKGCHFCGAI